MKYLFTFMAGVFVGAVAALFFAPASGEELRADLQEQVRKAEVELRKRSQEVTARMEDEFEAIKAQIQQAQEQLGEAGGPVEEEAAA